MVVSLSTIQTLHMSHTYLLASRGVSTGFWSELGHCKAANAEPPDDCIRLPPAIS